MSSGPSSLSCGDETCRNRVRAARRAGLLLIGHGTRNDQGTGEFLELAGLLQQELPSTPVEACFLELQSPDIDQAWRQLSSQGVDAIVAVPLLLFAAGHAKRDIPDALQAACSGCSSRDRKLCFVQTDPLACHPMLLELSEARTQQAIESSTFPVDRARTALVMVGRGSLDGHATAMMFRFSELRGQSFRPAVVRTGFVAMAEPKLPQVLDDVGRLPHIDTVIVQPHLLFQGDLNQRIEQMIDEAAARFTDRRWIKAQRLGPDPQLARTLAQIAQPWLNACPAM
ncbi:MAG: sirohydrochlorin chelatase [Pirellulaceae bacterium]